MGYMASWGPMGFIVSPQKIIALEKFTTSMTLKEDSENDTSGTEPTNTRGRELIPMAFSETCVAAAGVDPLARYSTWGALLGYSYPLMIGGNRIGPPRMKLKNVSMSDVVLSSAGSIIQATLSITLEEWSDGKTSALLEEGSETETEETPAGETGTPGETGGWTGTRGGATEAVATEQVPALTNDQKKAFSATIQTAEKLQFVSKIGRQAGAAIRAHVASTLENPT